MLWMLVTSALPWNSPAHCGSPGLCCQGTFESPCFVLTVCFMTSMVILQDAITLGAIPCCLATMVDMFGTMRSKHAVASFMNSAIVTNIARPYSYASIFRNAGSVAVRPGRGFCDEVFCEIKL